MLLEGKLITLFASALRIAGAIILPVALTNPLVNKLPLVVLPITLKLSKLPTEVKLLYKTFELKVLPIRAAVLL